MDEEQIIQKLHEQVQADLAKRAAVEEQTRASLAVVQSKEKLRQAELARIKRLDQIVDRYANLAELIKDTEQTSRELVNKAEKLIELLERSILNDSAGREWLEEFSEQITEIKYILLLILSNNPAEKEKVKRKLEKELLKQQTSNLDELELRAAQYGGRKFAPLDLLNQIRAIEDEIEKLGGSDG